MTAPDRIIKYMETYGKISSLICAKRLHITSLHKHLHTLKVRGYVFGKVWRKSKRDKGYYDYTIVARPKRTKK